MHIIVQSDGDPGSHAYVHAFGPFVTKEEAEEALPCDDEDGDAFYFVVEVEDKSKLPAPLPDEELDAEEARAAVNFAVEPISQVRDGSFLGGSLPVRPDDLAKGETWVPYPEPANDEEKTLNFLTAAAEMDENDLMSALFGAFSSGVRPAGK